MTPSPSEKDGRYLGMLRRSRQKVLLAMGGCFLTIFCLLLTANALQRTYGREQLPRSFDLLGTLLGASAFVTVLGGGLSAWLAIDSTLEYRRIKRRYEQEQPAHRESSRR